MEKKEKIHKKIYKTIIKKLYIGYGVRLFLNTILYIIFLCLGITFIFFAFDFKEQKIINYTEKSNLDYKVYLKQNDFYDTEYLEKDMLYIASLIDKVNIEFNYDFTSDEKINLNLDYKIMGKLSITDSTGKKLYFEKDYVLLDNKRANLNHDNNKKIKEIIDIDYSYYNSLANRFKTSYGLDSSSNFVIYFIINKDNDDKNIIINNSTMMSITIPLSEKSVNITMDYKDINNTSSIISESNVIIDSVVYIIFAFLSIILSFIILYRIIKLLTLLKKDRNKYDKYINKILIQYDRLIVETSTCPITTGKNIIKINKFQELLDVRDNLKLPIMYYVVVKHHKCYFYITHGNKIYLNVVKAIDLEKNVMGD